ncbi:hypothetical protein D9M71_472420 [compost metagenome]
MRGDQLAFPVQVAMADRFRQRLAFDEQASVGDIADFLGGNAADAEALLVLGRHEATGGQARQRLAQRNDASVVVLGQLLEAQAAARRQAAVDDVFTDPGFQLGSHGALLRGFGLLHPAFGSVHGGVPRMIADEADNTHKELLSIISEKYILSLTAYFLGISLEPIPSCLAVVTNHNKRSAPCVTFASLTKVARFWAFVLPKA